VIPAGKAYPIDYLKSASNAVSVASLTAPCHPAAVLALAGREKAKTAKGIQVV